MHDFWICSPMFVALSTYVEVGSAYKLETTRMRNSASMIYMTALLNAPQRNELQKDAQNPLPYPLKSLVFGWLNMLSFVQHFYICSGEKCKRDSTMAKIIPRLFFTLTVPAAEWFLKCFGMLSNNPKKYNHLLYYACSLWRENERSTSVGQNSIRVTPSYE